MKAITISQPYASLIASGEKWVENRNWTRLPSYRGPLAIHAGKGTQYHTRTQLRNYHTQCIVAVTELWTALWLADGTECKRLDMIPAEWPGSALRFYEFLCHPHTEGPVCLVLNNIRKLTEPVYCKGALGLWTVPEHVEAEVRRAIR